MTDNCCAECDGKIQLVNQRVDALAEKLDETRHRQDGERAEFSRHMEKEEAAFASFYENQRALRAEVVEALKELRKELGEIVMTGMENAQNLREEMADKYVSKAVAYTLATVLGFAIPAAVAVGIWAGSKDAAEKSGAAMEQSLHAHTEELRTIAADIVRQLKKAEEVDR